MTTPETLEALLRPLAERGEERFVALREKACEYAYLDGPHPADCPWCFFKARTDLGSLVRCAAACGLKFMLIPFTGSDSVKYGVSFVGQTHAFIADTPEEALARALVAAVGAEEAK